MWSSKVRVDAARNDLSDVRCKSTSTGPRIRSSAEESRRTMSASCECCALKLRKSSVQEGVMTMFSCFSKSEPPCHIAKRCIIIIISAILKGCIIQLYASKATFAFFKALSFSYYPWNWVFVRLFIFIHFVFPFFVFLCFFFFFSFLSVLFSMITSIHIIKLTE